MYIAGKNPSAAGYIGIKFDIGLGEVFSISGNACWGCTHGMLPAVTLNYKHNKIAFPANKH